MEFRQTISRVWAGLGNRLRGHSGDKRDHAREYQERMVKEVEFFKSYENVHDLPGIFHYWSNKYLVAKYRQFGFDNPKQFFSLYMQRACIELEVLFDKIYQTLHPDGYFVTDDMIGRNGHMRWPEALTVFNALWKELPEKYKYNHQLKRLEIEFDNWDCSKEAFEGIRSQDIL